MSNACEEAFEIPIPWSELTFLLVVCVYIIQADKGVPKKRFFCGRHLRNPAYHINKQHWNMVTLGGDVPEEDLKRMVGNSYDLTLPKVRRRLKIIIRQEQRSDYATVYELVKDAFTTVPYGDGTEADYLNNLRKKDVFIPALSFVAVSSGKIIGQIVLYKTPIETPMGIEWQLLLSPISVRPDYFRQGVARQMMEHALAKAKAMGFKAVFLCGAPAFYSKLGFFPTYKYGIYHKNDKTAEWSMVRELYEGALATIGGFIDTV